MKTKLLAMVLMAGSTMFAGVRFGVGVGFGLPVPAHIYVGARPACPGPGYIWMDGYTNGYGQWINGYWGAPPYAGAYWVGPRYVGGRFAAGYWGGEHREFVRHEEFRRGFRR